MDAKNEAFAETVDFLDGLFMSVNSTHSQQFLKSFMSLNIKGESLHRQVKLTRILDASQILMLISVLTGMIKDVAKSLTRSRRASRTVPVIVTADNEPFGSFDSHALLPASSLSFQLFFSLNIRKDASSSRQRFYSSIFSVDFLIW